MPLTKQERLRFKQRQDYFCYRFYPNSKFLELDYNAILGHKLAHGGCFEIAGRNIDEPEITLNRDEGYIQIAFYDSIPDSSSLLYAYDRLTSAIQGKVELCRWVHDDSRHNCIEPPSPKDPDGFCIFHTDRTPSAKEHRMEMTAKNESHVQHIEDLVRNYKEHPFKFQLKFGDISFTFKRVVLKWNERSTRGGRM